MLQNRINEPKDRLSIACERRTCEYVLLESHYSDKVTQSTQDQLIPNPIQFQHSISFHSLSHSFIGINNNNNSSSVVFIIVCVQCAPGVRCTIYVIPHCSISFILFLFINSVILFFIACSMYVWLFYYFSSINKNIALNYNSGLFVASSYRSAVGCCRLLFFYSFYYSLN